MTGLDGLYKDGYIFIDENLIPTKKKEVLAEEYGHYLTSVGDFIDGTILSNAKQETLPRNIALESLVTPEKLIECYEAGLSELWEVAEHLGISEEFLQAALHHYQVKCGLVFWYHQYQFVFLSDSLLDIKKYV